MATTTPVRSLPANDPRAPRPSSGALTINTPLDFAKALLNRLGVPDTPDNEQALVAWAAAEGGNWNNTATYNPFNTTLRMPGSTIMGGGNTAGVQAFISWQQGLDATVQTLQGYPQIIAALRSGNDAAAVANAVVNSAWGTKTIDLGSASAYSGQTSNANVVSAAGTGSGAAAPYAASTPYPITPDVQRWIMQNAPQDAWMLSNPELANILGWAGQTGQTDTSAVQGLISQTNWYKTHSEAQRSWIQIYASDPQAAKKAIDDARINIQNQAGQMGVTLTSDQLNTLAINYNYYGWSVAPQDLTNAIAALMPIGTSAQNPTQGQAGTDFQSLKALASQTWGVPTSDNQIQQWTQQILSGQQSIDGVTALLKTQAQSMYPTLADQFSRGFTFAQATDPYKSIAQQYLNVSPDSINFTDPKWMPALNQIDPKTGQRTEMGLDQWATYIRSTPSFGYQNSMQAKNMTSDLGAAIGTFMKGGV